MDLGQALRKIRVQKEMTQTAVCKKAKLSQTYLSQVEKGRKEPRKATVKKLCKVYGVPPIVVAWMGSEESDIQKNKLELYRQLKPAMDGLISEFLK